MNNLLSRQYIAGYFDGEGCVSITRDNRNRSNSFNIYISLGSTVIEPLLLLKEIYSGSIKEYKNKGGVKRKTIWYWVITSKLAEIFLEDIKDYLIIKRPQAELALELRKLIPKRSSRHPKEEIEEMTRRKLVFKEKMHQLNYRGV